LKTEPGVKNEKNDSISTGVAQLIAFKGRALQRDEMFYVININTNCCG